jgi:hypothetical protein
MIDAYHVLIKLLEYISLRSLSGREKRGKEMETWVIAGLNFSVCWDD